MIFFTLAAVIMGGTFRFINLDAHVVWHDEVHTILRALGFTTQEVTTDIFDGKLHSVDELEKYQRWTPSKTLLDTLKALASHPEHSPLYYLLVRFVAPYFKTPIFGARLLSALCSLLLFPAVYFLSQRLFIQYRSAPLMAVCITALAPVQIIYAREARQYAIYEVFVVAATYFLIKACQDKRGWKWYGIALILGLYTHLMFFLLIPTHLCFIALTSFRKSCWRQFSLTVAMAGICFTPWIWVVIQGMTALQKHTAWMSEPLGLPALAAGWARHLGRLLFDLPGMDMLWYLSIPLVLLSFLFTMLKSSPQSALLLGLITGGNIFPLIIPDLLHGGHRSMEVRYFLSAMLSLQLGLVFCFAYMAEKSRLTRRIVFSMTSGLLVTTAFFGYRYLTADTWWNKNFSSSNPKISRLINAAPRPLIITDLTPITPGEVLSLAYLVVPQTKFLLPAKNQKPTLPNGYTLMAFKPSYAFRRKLMDQYGFSPVNNTKDELFIKRTGELHQVSR